MFEIISQWHPLGQFIFFVIVLAAIVETIRVVLNKETKCDCDKEDE